MLFAALTFLEVKTSYTNDTFLVYYVAGAKVKDLLCIKHGQKFGATVPSLATLLTALTLSF